VVRNLAIFNGVLIVMLVGYAHALKLSPKSQKFASPPSSAKSRRHVTCSGAKLAH